MHVVSIGVNMQFSLHILTSTLFKQDPWTSQPQNRYKLSIKFYAEDLYGLSRVNGSAKSELRSCKLHSLALKCSVALK